MRRRVSSVTTLTVVGMVLVLAGLTAIGASAVSASGAPSLSFNPDFDMGSIQAVAVTVSGFKGKTDGGLSQCNLTPGEPTIEDVTTRQLEPVGCAPFTPVKTTKKGTFFTGYGVQAGVNGPPDSGLDSAGTTADGDAPTYPCPPTAAQISAGGTCALVFTDVLGQTASQTVDYYFDTTTTTTTPIVGCTPTAASATDGSAIVTVTPANCLVDDSMVSVSGSGLQHNDLGTLVECNATPGQPTVQELATAVPVGCTSTTKYLVMTSSNGDLPVTTVAIVTGTVGPPATGTDSSGGSATTDAADYPCPPTPAQVAAGVTCVLEFNDTGHDLLTVPLSFYAPPTTPSGRS